MILQRLPETNVRYKDLSFGGDVRDLAVSFEKIKDELRKMRQELHAEKVSTLKQKEKYTYMDSIFIKSNKLFTQQGFELWDMSNLNKYGSNDSETLDGFHGSETSYLKMLIYMVENGSELKKYTNINNLRHDLDNRKNGYEVYD